MNIRDTGLAALPAGRGAPAMPAFLDVGFTYHALREELDAAWRRVMLSGSYVLGSEVAGFERAFAAWCGARHCVGLGNGLDALKLALRAAGVRAGDEVVVSGHTFIATWLAILECGAVPVPVDACPDTMLIQPEGILRALTPSTRAVLTVPLYGLPVDPGPVKAELAARGIALVEDAAQAHGATLGGARIGTLADITAFSFYPGKNLGAFGDGGAIVTDRADWAENIRRWANYGSREKYVHEDPGINSRLDELQAALLSVKLPHLDAWTERRRTVARRYLDGLRSLPGLALPASPAGSDPAWHLFVLRHEKRDLLRQELEARGVTTLMHYPVPPHRSQALRDRFGHLALPETERICATCFSLPIGPHMGPAEAELVVEAVRDALRALDGRKYGGGRRAAC